MRFNGRFLIWVIVFHVLLSIPAFTYAQCDFYGSINVSASGYEAGSGFTQEYVLVNDNSDLILAINATGSFTSLANDTYRVFAINYTGSRPAEIAVGNSWAAYISNSAAYCCDYIGPYSGGAVRVCSTVCDGDDLVVSTSGHNLSGGFEQRYVVVDVTGTIVAANSTGTFSGLSVGEYSVYAVNTDDNTLKSEVDDMGPWSDITGCPSGICYNILGARNVEVEDCTVLPVSVIQFNAVLKDDVVFLGWETLSEINNDYFTVEKSKDGVTFIPVATVLGAGNSNTNIKYKETDPYPYLGLSYYRLSQTDFDGTVSFSGIEEIVYMKSKDINLIVYPSPASDFVNLELSGLGDRGYKYQVTDISGRSALRGEVTEHTDGQIQSIRVDNLRKGYYLVQICTSKGNTYSEFIKE